VAVQVNEPTKFDKILLMPAQLAVDSGSVVHFSVKLEDDISAGPLPLIATARPKDSGAAVESDVTWHLVVQRGVESVTDLEVSPPHLKFNYIGDSSTLSVIGTLSSGKRISLAGDSKLNYSANPDILSVDQSQQVIALAPGKGTMYVMYGPNSEESAGQIVKFEVLNNSIRGDFDNDHDVDSEDLDILKATEGQQTVPNDARDLNNDGKIDAGDEIALQALCTRTRCAVNDDLSWGMLPSPTATPVPTRCVNGPSGVASCFPVTTTPTKTPTPSGNQAGGGGGCFLGGTLILMADNSTKPIEQVKEGDEVIEFDEKTFTFHGGKVTKLFSHQADRYMMFNNTLRITDNHPVFLKGKWVEAGTLKKGDLLLGENKKPIAVESIKLGKASVDVFNLEVEPYHSYIAGGIVVHNKGPLRMAE
jgi:hypothetical protein